MVSASVEEVPQRVARRPERELVPGQAMRFERLHLGGLLGRARAVRRARGVDDQHDALLRAAIDADERAELDRDVELLAGLAVGGLLDRLAEVDEAAGERPQVLARVEGATEQDDLAVRGDRDRGGDRLGVVVGAVAAVRAGDRARVVDVGRLGATRAEAGLAQRGVEIGQEKRSS
jgi:hypothetical protein